MLTIRPAVESDLDGIMDIERESFGSVDTATMASREIMHSRIHLLNHFRPKWFWVAEHDKKLVGYMILQPTNLTPDDCTSWGAATDHGTLKNTFDPHGINLYGVSLGILDDAPEGVIELLMHRKFLVWLEGRQECFMICSRIPGYAKAFAETGIDPDAYWKRTLSNGEPEDWMLRHFAKYVRVTPTRLLINGFPEDPESMGHGVLCINKDPLGALAINAVQIYEIGLRVAHKGGS